MPASRTEWSTADARMLRCVRVSLPQLSSCRVTPGHPVPGRHRQLLRRGKSIALAAAEHRWRRGSGRGDGYDHVAFLRRYVAEESPSFGARHPRPVSRRGRRIMALIASVHNGWRLEVPSVALRTIDEAGPRRGSPAAVCPPLSARLFRLRRVGRCAVASRLRWLCQPVRKRTTGGRRRRFNGSIPIVRPC
jgi:hypothetical protein